MENGFFVGLNGLRCFAAIVVRVGQIPPELIVAVVKRQGFLKARGCLLVTAQPEKGDGHIRIRSVIWAKRNGFLKRRRRFIVFAKVKQSCA
jgi:hypothetical protein